MSEEQAFKKYFNDAPVTKPEEDSYGIAPFAQALAASFRKMSRPVGTTIGLNGPWGSGKTSAVNLVRHYLASAADGPIVVDFKCWWFKGEEALTLAFLQELRSAVQLSLGDKAKDIFGKLGRKLLQAGPIVGPAVNLATGGLLGALAGGASDMANKVLSDDDPLEKVMGDLSKALANQDRRYLVILDDIDRLAPDDALQIFRLIKSVGRLPNVMYLAVFDRQLAERAVSQRYPSEGPHYLEKIIQASFELPPPSANDLYNAALAQISAICGEPTEPDLQRFWNIFYSAVAPFLRLPRDVVRLANALSVTWPPVAGEVDIADFVAMEVMRLSEPALYIAVRGGAEILCGTSSGRGGERAATTLEDLCAKVRSEAKETVKEALQRLFPRLEGVGYTGSFESRWDAKRLVCSERHFPHYFRFALGDGVLSSNDLKRLIDHAADDGYVRAEFRAARSTIRRNGQSRVPILLEELKIHAREVASGDVQPLITTLFAIADELQRPEDLDRTTGYGIDASIRLHWLIRSLTKGRPLAERSAIYMSAARAAQIGWLTDFFLSSYRDYHPTKGDTPEREDDCLVTEADLPELQRLFLARVQQAVSAGSLLNHPQLGSILFRWLDHGGDEGAGVRAWVADLLKEDKSVARLAEAFTSEGFVQGIGMGVGLGDRVARKVPHAGVSALAKLLDIEIFRKRIDELAQGGASLTEAEKKRVAIFREAWARDERDEDD